MDRDATLTFDKATTELTDYARAQGLLTLCKGPKANTSGGAKVFTADGEAPRETKKHLVPKSERPCRLWADKRCTYGDKCIFSHDAAGGACLVAKARRKKRDGSDGPSANEASPQAKVDKAVSFVVDSPPSHATQEHFSGARIFLADGVNKIVAEMEQTLQHPLVCRSLASCAMLLATTWMCALTRHT